MEIVNQYQKIPISFHIFYLMVMVEQMPIQQEAANSMITMLHNLQFGILGTEQQGHLGIH